MTVTYSAARDQLRRILEPKALVVPAPSVIRYSDELLFEAWVEGQRAVAPYAHAYKTESVVGDGSANVFALTDDSFLIRGVFDDDNSVFLQKLTISGGQVRNGDLRNWMEYPIGSANLSFVPASGDTFTVYYAGYHDEPADKDDTTFVLTLPRYAMAAARYYAAHYCMDAQMPEHYAGRSHGQTPDRGVIQDSPWLEGSKHFMGMFYDEIKRFPKVD